MTIFLAQVFEYVALAPAVTNATPAPVVEFVAHSLVMECVEPAPSVTYVTPSERFSPFYTMEAVTDTTDLVNPLCAITAVEDSAPQVVGSFPPLDEFASSVHQEQFVATQNFREIPKECHRYGCLGGELVLFA